MNASLTFDLPMDTEDTETCSSVTVDRSQSISLSQLTSTQACRSQSSEQMTNIFNTSTNQLSSTNSTSPLTMKMTWIYPGLGIDPNRCAKRRPVSGTFGNIHKVRITLYFFIVF